MTDHSVATAHAILRWLERVDKFDLHPVKIEMRQEGLDANNPGEVLHHLWKTRRINAADIARNMVSPEVLLAIKAQARSIRHNGAVLLLASGRIATVITVEQHSLAAQRREDAILRRQEKSRSRNGRKTNRRAERYADADSA